MILTTFILLVIITLLLELFVYKSIVKRYIHSKFFRYTFIIKQIAIPLLLLATTLAYNSTLAPWLMATLTWVVWIFVLNTGVIFLFSIPRALGWISDKIFKRAKIEKWSICVGGTLSAILVGLMIYGATIGRTSLRVEYVEISSPRIPAAFDGYKIAHFSDTHIGNLALTTLLDKLADSISTTQPDIIIQTGDVINIHAGEYNTHNIQSFRKMQALDGVVSVLGNHDLGFYIGSSKGNITPLSAFENNRTIQRDSLGWQLLENDNFFIYRGTDSIAIAGVTYPKNLNHNNFNSTYGGSNLRSTLEDINDSTYTILASHSPQLFDSIPSIGKADLTLSGHVHSFQMKFNICGKTYSPAHLMYPMYSGLYQKGRFQLYINDGLGYVLFPMRIGARPELTIITLRHSDQ